MKIHGIVHRKKFLAIQTWLHYTVDKAIDPERIVEDTPLHSEEPPYSARNEDSERYNHGDPDVTRYIDDFDSDPEARTSSVDKANHSCYRKGSDWLGVVFICR